MPSIKLRKNETFYIRDNWFEKAVNTIHDADTNIFSKNLGIGYLGIGSTMVKSLKYWLRAAQVIGTENNELTELGELIYQYDQYLDDSFSWYLIHYFLTLNYEECPIHNEIFNADMSRFDKISMMDYLAQRLPVEDNKVNRKYIDNDLGVFIKSYINENPMVNPEENYICPLSRLKLMKKDKDYYVKNRPVYSSLSYLIIYYALLQKYQGNSFEIEESIQEKDSPVRIFNLDKYMYLQYLDDARRNGLITINRAAGLNTVYFEKELTLKEIFDAYFGGDHNVQ